MLQIPKKNNFVPKRPTTQGPMGYKPFPVAMLYTKGLSEKLQPVFREHGLTIYQKPWNTIRQSLVSPKDKLDKMCVCGAIYEIACGELVQKEGEGSSLHQ